MSMNKEELKQDLTSVAASSDAATDARQILTPLRNEILQLLQKLVQIDTVAIPPNGSETKAQQALRDYLNSYGLDVELYDLEFLSQTNHPYLRSDRNYSGRHNLITRLSGSGRGRSLLLSGHIDTVPAGHDRWDDSPWSGIVRDGRLYGRGSYDMKSLRLCSVHVALDHIMRMNMLRCDQSGGQRKFC
jgi:acetylornithine deacetylase/succinyl-diaminopimelate desuccinylase-like protein